ncbi:Sodium/calcium exchanger NCL2 [Porphyridium purpureum]|uniref:Sodium/calcium exchanger NCL2 n=1 Tax=Porphyridium purpureum TaxID=35688 RepID=A0A5J4YN78_PORPP|nr:Sodium/calcium exchanger NCL2 [Porphyridium purpureum]|eukprot:POR6876..scf295_9
MASALFIDPAGLPGGKEFLETCAAAGKNEELRAMLRCGSSTAAMLGFFQSVLLMVVYGYVLYTASNMIADGSELLLLVPSLRNVVGSVVLPILGAVPDGAIILFSAMGGNAQEEVAVGIGALAGSTIMLLTVPWVLSIVGGRVSILPSGTLNYKKSAESPEPFQRLNDADKFSLSRAGVGVYDSVQHAGKLLLLTSISYLVIQGPAFASGTWLAANATPHVVREAAKKEHWFALFGFVVCILFFVYYLYEQIKDSQSGGVQIEDKLDQVRERAIQQGKVTLSGAFYRELVSAAHENERVVAGETTSLTKAKRVDPGLRVLLKTFFSHFDIDNSGSIDKQELNLLMVEMGEYLTENELRELYKKIDANESGLIDFDEFCVAMPSFIMNRAHYLERKSTDEAIRKTSSRGAISSAVEATKPTEDDDDDESEEEEEVPEDLQDKDPSMQMRKIMTRSLSLMAMGTALVLIFSDPMCDVLGDLGFRMGVSGFYTSFVMAPLCSNASELLASYKYSLKRTRRTQTISFAALLGAGVMNNTFCLAIFMIIVFAKGLAWKFSAETLSILFVEIMMFFMSQRKVHTVRHALMVISLYPLSLLLVGFLENVVGLD